MKLSTNYNKTDWYRFIISGCISIIPVIVVVSSIFFALTPLVHFWSAWVDFLTDNYILADFRDHMYDDLGYEGDLTVMFFIGWLGFLSAPLFGAYGLNRTLPIDWIIKKLKIEPRMKLVVFWNGKPLRWRFKQ